MPFRPDAFSGIGLVVKVPNVIFVTNDLPVRTLADLVSYAKSRPGQLNYGSSGSGTSLHLTAELLKSVADIDLQHVPFRGSGPMNLEVISGRIHVGVDNLPSVVGHIRDGRVRALAVTTSARSPSLPDLPTTAEAGFPGVEATARFGPLAPSRTPRAIVEKLGAATNEVVSSPIFWPRLADLGGMKPDLVPGGGTSPDSYQAFINAEISRWSEVVKRSGATVE
jgi:tripartite-type tricarboxylate transporter receptor subunit TctC